MKDGKVTWTIEWYQAHGAEPPLKSFLEGLTGRDKDEAIAVMELLEKWGNQLRPPRSEPLGDGLFEWRGHQVRIFYVFRPGRRIVLLDGMVKKQDKIPTRVLERVRGYQQEVRTKDAKAVRGP